MRLSIALVLLASATAAADPSADAIDPGAGSGSAAPATTTAPATPIPAAPVKTAAIEPHSTQATVGTVEVQNAVPGVAVGDVKFELHGYARMPLTMQGSREPYLVDNDYYLSGFAYTRLYEPDWSELFFSA